MSYLIGIDVGTSSTKSLLMRSDGMLIGTAQRKYDIISPFEGWSEQNVDDLWKATCETLQELAKRFPREILELKGIGYSGQMHGLVMLDKDMRPIRNCIIWNDQRSIGELEKIRDTIPSDEFNRTTLNQLSTGYWVSSLSWVKTHEPENLAKTHIIMLPKDYVRLRMTGEIGTDMTDASSTVIFDTAGRHWAWEFIDRLGFDRNIFPRCYESHELAGQLTEETAALTGLPARTPVVYGGGDTLMHEVGVGMIDESCPWVANIGTSCQVTCAMNRPAFDPLFRTNSFCQSEEGHWMLMSVNLSGGASMKWIGQQVFPGIGFEEQTKMASMIPAGSEGLIFLPYLTGARSPEVDPLARGMFMGLTMRHGQPHFVRATIEGVIYSLRNAYETLKDITKREPEYIIATGGGARSKLLLQIEADMFGKPIRTTKEAEQSCLGACITAGVGTGIYASFEEACQKVIHFKDEIVNPDPENSKIYNEYFDIYRNLYISNRELFHRYPR